MNTEDEETVGRSLTSADVGETEIVNETCPRDDSEPAIITDAAEVVPSLPATTAVNVGGSLASADNEMNSEDSDENCSVVTLQGSTGEDLALAGVEDKEKMVDVGRILDSAGHDKPTLTYPDGTTEEIEEGIACVATRMGPSMESKTDVSGVLDSAGDKDDLRHPSDEESDIFSCQTSTTEGTLIDPTMRGRALTRDDEGKRDRANFENSDLNVALSTSARQDKDGGAICSPIAGGNLVSAGVGSHTEARWRADYSKLKSETNGLSYRHSKDMRDVHKTAIDWDSVVKGIDEGDGWLRVGNLYLPMISGGAPVMVHFADKKLKDTNDNHEKETAEPTSRDQAFNEPPTQSLPGDGKRGNIGSSIYCRGSSPAAIGN